MENEESLELPGISQKLPGSKFLTVECPDCTSKQVIFSHASNEVKCSVCGRILAKSTGGKARILGKLVEKHVG
ncbi:MAG: 30S ribosomal protein S27e [Candidatus Korarchaeota archaeon]|nr:30S ribosomal protein S27e [Candidatus Korarchaeota archaeon]NIU82440.1 30S ribosomal protein S27e [Candidatus Thorarchaeota archaeon]NIW13246.1 30S ribosomal protein S27e [Candidatus Thorarchaeota archaeon]NIW51376.1 30S ribosomal protein S27e [Candidatus Korarchaeota archaeon]